MKVSHLCGMMWKRLAKGSTCLQSYCCSIAGSHSRQNHVALLGDTFHPKTNCTRNTHTSCPRWLQLKNEQTFEEWQKDYFINFYENKKAIAQKGINHHPVNVLTLREFFVVLVKDKSDFAIPSDWQDDEEIFAHPDVLATNHVRRGIKPLIIYNRYNTMEEWERNLGQFIDEFVSRSLVLASTMGFVTFSQLEETKIDQSINHEEFLTTPLAESFIDYILNEERNIPHCQRALVIYMKHCNNVPNGGELGEKIYGRAREKIPLFGIDFMTFCSSTHILGETKYREDILKFNKLLSAIKCKPNLFIEKEVEIALYDNNVEQAVRLIGIIFKNPKEYLAKRSGVLDTVINSLFSKLRYEQDPENWERNKEIIETFIILLRNCGLFPGSKTAALHIGEWFTSIPDEKWDYKLIHNDRIRNRQCPFTKVYLDEKVLRDEEYEHLRKVVMMSILKKESNQGELRSFFSTIYDNGPFDIVVDGLNLVYGLRSRMRNVPSASEVERLTVAWLRNFVQQREHDSGKKLNVLVVSRDHMAKHANMYQDFATTWLASNDSNDDPFFLYAALISGRNCKLLTLDLLKDVHYKITQNFDYMTVKLIYKWQQIHQDLVILRKSTGMRRQEYDVSIQRTPDTLHIPFFGSESTSPAPTDWLCLKKLS
ncbi:uncharacterized protein LOC120331809 [Styela clava]